MISEASVSVGGIERNVNQHRSGTINPCILKDGSRRRPDHIRVCLEGKANDPNCALIRKTALS